jgi:DNA polymerase III delta subunit
MAANDSKSTRRGSARPDYQAFRREFAALLRELGGTERAEEGGFAVSKWPRLMILFGESEFFIARAVTALVELWKRGAGADSVQAVDAVDVTADSLLDLVLSQGLFDECQLVVVRRSEKKSDIGKLLSAMPPLSSWSNCLLVACQKATLPAELQRQSNRLGGREMAVVEPYTSQDFLSFIQASAQRSRIRLTPEAEHILQAACGRDPVLLENEIRRLSLVYSATGRESPDIGAAEVAAVVGFLREDEVFKLDELLLNKRHAEVEMLLHQFVARGESPLAVTGVLARHARNGLAVKSELDRRGAVDVPAMAARLHLPQAVVRNLVRHVAGVPRHSFERALSACAAADFDLKTSGLPDGLALSRIVTCFQS